MWSLLPTPWRKRVAIWLQLALIVVVWHVLLLWLLIGYRGALYQHHLTIDMIDFKKDIKTIVIPLVKTIAPTPAKISGKQSSPEKTASAPALKEIKEKLSAKQEVKRDVISAQPVVTKKTKAKSEKKKEVPVKKSPEEKKVTPTTPLEVKKEQKIEKPPIVADKKKADEKSSQELVSVEREGESNDKQVLYIGREDAQAQQLYEAVYEAVRLVWRSPPGFGSQVQAQVEIILNWDGTIEKYTMIHSSGVPLFDACVRRDSKKIMFPRAAWGKTWILTFSNDTKVTYE